MSKDDFNLHRQPKQPPPIMVNIPLVHFGAYSLNVAAIIAFDSSRYEVARTDRAMTVSMWSGERFEFTGPLADEVMLWFLEVTGRNKITR